MFKYTATVYWGTHILDTKSSNDLNALLVWMLTEGDKEFGESRGQIVNNFDCEIVQRFKKNSQLN
ncbi:hypothetical protein DI119_15430 [Legionella pneumophila]|uniref:Uncharacterized protein n=1 Tax=Fluoribacter dumoffii TaxID=463 RepID=A0A377IV29_9GAMM|nr:hypothetical protein DI119_15430 [Legionella pneumophila]STO91743.1 Uncharacterised protein [Fluoribacter dumoffii]